MGHDPTTLELWVSCSTDWASRAVLENIEELESFFFICGQALRQMELKKFVFWIFSKNFDQRGART